MATLPIAFASNNWYTISYIAHKMGRNKRTVLYWAQSGLFARMGLKVIVVPAKRMAGRAITWVNIPKNGKCAMFNRVHLDTYLPKVISSQCNERPIQGC